MEQLNYISIEELVGYMESPYGDLLYINPYSCLLVKQKELNDDKADYDEQELIAIPYFDPKPFCKQFILQFKKKGNKYNKYKKMDLLLDIDNINLGDFYRMLHRYGLREEWERYYYEHLYEFAEKWCWNNNVKYSKKR